MRDLLSRIRGEFLEMPGLRLTREQARRLWALDDTTCRWLLDALVEARFLTLQPDGRYGRPSERNAAPNTRLRQ
jgi:hypothetical protein